MRDACGRSSQELIDQPLSRLHTGFQSPDKLAELEKCCRQRRTYKNRSDPEPGGGALSARSWHIVPVFRAGHLANLVCLISEDAESADSVAALRASEKRYRDLFEHGRVGKAVIGHDQRFVTVNRSFSDLVGYSAAELAGSHASVVLHETQRDLVLAHIRSIFAGNSPGYQSESQYVRKDGTLVTALVDLVPEHDEHGCIRAVVVQAQNITGLKTTEAALRESENQLKAILDHSPAEVYLKDAEGRYVMVNRQFEKVFNVRDAQVRGKYPWDIHYAELADRSRAHDLEVLTSGEDVAREEEVWFEHSDDELPHILHIFKFPILDQGEVTGLGAIATDITEMKRAESAVRQSEARLRDFAEIAADWFWETDEDLVITYVSDVHRQITGIPDEQIIGRTREELFEHGIYKAADPAVHLRTLDKYWDSMVEYSVTREDGREIFVHDRASPFFDSSGGFKGYRGVGRDVTEQRLLTRRIAHHAIHDSLTGAVNRREFERRLDEIVAEVQRSGGEHTLCFLDLDKFKLLNDTLGHAAGDYLLKRVVETIQEQIGPADLLGRIGGDEFGILLRNTGPASARQLAVDLVQTVTERDFKWEERTFNIAMSVGVAPINRQTKSSSELLARADSACYRAKEAGNDGVWVSDESEAARLRTYTDILRSLTSGPDMDLSGNFLLVGQPICSMLPAGGGPPWYEVLLRLVGNDGRFYRPYEFIRVAEQHGKMPMIDQWVLETAIVSHAEIASRVPGAIMSINLSGTSLADKHLLSRVESLVKTHRIEPGNLCFEIGERTAMSDLKRTTALVEALSDQGYRVALDEFGSGPASFACLRQLTVQYVKLYGELVRGLGQQASDLAIVETIHELSRRMGLTAIAVQVETQDAANSLKTIGVELGQGEALATTSPLATLVSDLSRRRHG